MQPLDGYEPFRELVAALRQRGNTGAAWQIVSAMSAGSTGSEALGELGLALKELWAELSDRDAKTLQPLLDRCKAVIQIAWQDYS